MSKQSPPEQDAAKAQQVLTQIQPIQRETLSRRVYADLRELLISGQFQPGQKLTLRALSSALGTSQMPVREAVKHLGAEMALEILPNRSVRVPVMTKQRFRELLLLRCTLEGLAIETAVMHLDAAELATIEQSAHHFEQEMSAPQPDIAHVIQHNKDLHFGIYRAARLPQLLALIETLWLQVGPVLNVDLRSGSRRLSEATAVEHHRQMLEGLRLRDAKRARQALLGDLNSAARVILESQVLKD